MTNRFFFLYYISLLLFSDFCTFEWKSGSCTTPARAQPDSGGQQQHDLRGSQLRGSRANHPPAISQHAVRAAPGRAHSSVNTFFCSSRNNRKRKWVSHPDPVLTRALSDPFQWERMRKLSVDPFVNLSPTGLPHG